jgi:hypothetical protein
LSVVVRVTFTEVAPGTQPFTREWAASVGPGEPWGIRLTDLLPEGQTNGKFHNARAMVVCDGGATHCTASVANWYQPGIPAGVAPETIDVPFRCR